MTRRCFALLREFPICFQRQILFLSATGLLFIIIAIVSLLLNANLPLALPVLILAAFLLYHAARHFRMAATGAYSIVRGLCAEIQITPLRHLTREITLQAPEGTIVIRMKRKLSAGITPGTAIKLYLSNQTPVYEKDGVLRIFDVIAIEVDRSSVV